MYFSEGIILGLSTGAVCLANCGPVLIPYLLGESKKIKKNVVYVSLFLAGRLVSYIIMGLLTGLAGIMFLQPTMFTEILLGISYIILSILLILYGFHRFREICLGSSQKKITSKYDKNWPFLVPLSGGIITGLNICPPFLLAITRAVSTGNIRDSVLFFIMFFIGTSLFFIPLPLLGILRKYQVLRIIGKLAAIFAGFIYMYKGILMTIN